MIRIKASGDLNWVNLYRVAYQSLPVEIDESLLRQVDAGHDRFNELVAGGLQSYGVTTGLGKLVDAQLDDDARAELPANMLRARASAIGTPFCKPETGMAATPSSVSSAVGSFRVPNLSFSRLMWRF